MFDALEVTLAKLKASMQTTYLQIHALCNNELVNISQTQDYCIYFGIQLLYKYKCLFRIIICSPCNEILLTSLGLTICSINA